MSSCKGCLFKPLKICLVTTIVYLPQINVEPLSILLVVTSGSQAKPLCSRWFRAQIIKIY